jgi:ribosomal protein S8
LILGYKVLNKNFVKIYLKFDNSGNPVIKDFFLISTFSRKRYMRVSDIKSNNIQKNYFFFLNTSKGILSHEKALIKKVGGEVFFKICV